MPTDVIQSPIGAISIEVKDGFLVALSISQGEIVPSVQPEWTLEPRDERCLELAKLEISAYFDGSLREFTVPVRLNGPAYYRRVWDWLLENLRFGATATYQEVARAIGTPRAARAVGQACAKNPVPLIVPCHRVLASKGLGGYGPGLSVKRWLLEHESQKTR